jgi:hypothetical protein
MAYFVYIYSQTGPRPQIIHDEKMAEYVRSQNHLKVLIQFPLTGDEAKLSLAALLKIYPYKDPD